MGVGPETPEVPSTTPTEISKYQNGLEDEGTAEQRSTSLAGWLSTESFFCLSVTPGSPSTCAWQDTSAGIAACTESTTFRVLFVFPQKHTQATLGSLTASLMDSFESSIRSVLGPIPVFLVVLWCLGMYRNPHCKCAWKGLKSQSFHHVLPLKVHQKVVTDPKAIGGCKIGNTSVH